MTAEKSPQSTMRDRRTFLKTAGIASAIGLAGCIGDEGDGADDGTDDGTDGTGDDGVEWTIGTSGPDSATHASGVAISGIVSEESDRIDMSAQTTQGTAANPRLMDEGDIDISQSTTWAVEKGNAEEEPYGDDPLEMTLTQVLPFMSIEYFLIKRDVDELADIETVSDIPQDGSIDMAFGQRGGTNWFAGEDGFELSGITDLEDKYNMQSLSWGDQRAQLSDGRLDIGMGYSISLVTLVGWEQELDATQDIDVVEWEFSEEDVEQSPEPYEYIEAPADVWEQDIRIDPIPSLGVGYTSIFPASMDDDLVYEYVELVHENVDDVRDASQVLQGAGPELTEELTLAAPNSPVHPGAEEFMREEGLWSDEFTTLEEFES